MNHQADDQLELLKLLLQEQPTSQDMQENEQESDKQPSSEVKQEVQNSQRYPRSSGIETRPDPGREQRKGTPEVIFGETKDVAQITAMAQGLLRGSGRAIISRVPPEAIVPIQAAFQAYTVVVRQAARAIIIYQPGYVRQRTGGSVGVISAGTSDVPVAEEAALIAEEMGCDVTCIYDVGVAGLHRLIEPLRTLLSNGVDAIIVAAGMDGALPSVVAGLVPVPVIGLPTSIGYGLGGKGVAALLSMLQTCAPGLSVVNIDNGVGAGITAALIANRVAQAREHHLQ
ncbi:MAG TPA: nickel pincer cofactor biosynthesis protein LarB [Ktedonobacteraceae bacterium]|nr:nickel pincer cofactor biosynthesis protein LarB [Ktedonobacteraceae bacterium]